MPVGVTTRSPALRPRSDRIHRLQPHLVVEGADDELTYRRGAAVREERPHAQVRTHAPHAGCIDAPVAIGANHAVLHALALQRQRHSAARTLREVTRVLANGPQIARHLIRDHLLQPEPEQVRRIAAVGTRDDVAAESRRAAWTPVTTGATLDQAGADGAFRRDVADAIVRARPESLHQRELPLEQLAPAPDRAGRVARDDVGGRIRCQPVTDARADLLIERLEDARAFDVRRLGLIRELRVRRLPCEQQ